MASQSTSGQTPLNIGLLPVTNFMPATGRPFRFSSYVTIPNQGAAATVVQFVVEQGYNGIINAFGNVFIGGGFQEGAGLISWTLFLDIKTNLPAKGFTNILASFGAVSNPATLPGIRIKENQTVTLVVNNANPGVVPAGQKIGGLLGGYYYPVSLEPPSLGF
jgi:hypothetical protein